MEPWQIIVLLGAVAVAGSALLPHKNDHSDQSQTVRNMETALEQFMENMEADNREIVGLVTKAQQEANQQALKREERINELEKRCAELEISLAEQSKSAFQHSIIETEALRPTSLTTIRIRYAELFELHDKGKSVEAIAKKVNMNKGEVQLILQLSKQEEAVRHE